MQMRSPICVYFRPRPFFLLLITSAPLATSTEARLQFASDAAGREAKNTQKCLGCVSSTKLITDSASFDSCNFFLARERASEKCSLARRTPGRKRMRARHISAGRPAAIHPPHCDIIFCASISYFIPPIERHVWIKTSGEERKRCCCRNVPISPRAALCGKERANERGDAPCDSARY
jgi:hypothetical protein